MTAHAILVIHKLPYPRRMLKEGFEERGHRVVVALGAEEAAVAARKLPPTVIVADPGSISADALRALASQAPARVVLDVPDTSSPEQVRAWVEQYGAAGAVGRGKPELVLEALEQPAANAADLHLTKEKRMLLEWKAREEEARMRDDGVSTQALLERGDAAAIDTIVRRALGRPRAERSRAESDLILLDDLAHASDLERFLAGDSGEDAGELPGALGRAGFEAQAAAVAAAWQLLPGATPAATLMARDEQVYLVREDPDSERRFDALSEEAGITPGDLAAAARRLFR